MIRFYCTSCKRVRRARSYPIIISNQHSINPRERVGQCNRHSDYKPKYRAGSIRAKLNTGVK